MKKIGLSLVLFLLISSFLIGVLNISLINASSFSENIKAFFSPFNSPDDINVSTMYLKYLVLALLIVLIYSALGTANFPENAGLRLILAIIVGLLGTIYFSSSEILSIMESYKAMGLAITLFFPILILAFFTYFTATKGKAAGILSQRILWMFYSIYLFVRLVGLMVVRWFGESLNENTSVLKVIEFLFGTSGYEDAAKAGDPIIMIMLVVAAITVFGIFVIGNKRVVQFLMAEQSEVDAKVLEDEIKRQDAKRKAESGSTRG